MTATWWQELWRYRELLYFLAWRDVKVRYKQAAFGAAWAVLQPLFTMIIFTLFFGRLAGVPSDGMPYPLFSFCGLTAWMYFSTTVGQAGNSLVSNASLLTKVYFPRVLLPAATAMSGLIDLGVALVFLGAMMLYYGVHPGWPLLLAPLLLLLMVLLVLGLSMLLAAVNVRYRDIKYVVPFLLQIWLFVTPIIYPMSFLPPQYRRLVILNPMTGIVEGLRASITWTGKLDWSAVGVACIVTLLTFVAGIAYFRKAEREFADVV